MFRVQKILSNYGFCSRRKAEEYIAAGRVKVNDKTISLGDKAGDNDIISVDNKIITSEKKVYLMFNKPIGCVTALKDKHYKTIMSYIKIKERVFPIGRLDKDTSGLILLTNDGDFANNIAHPSNEVRKTYVATLNKEFPPPLLKKIQKGIKLEDGITAPAKANILSNKIVELTIHEGKNRIVRRIFEALDFKVVKLERIKIGQLKLNIPVEKYRDLTEEDKEKIFLN